MNRLIPVLALVAAIVIALVLTRGGGEEEAATPQQQPASVLAINVARLDGSAEFALADLASAPKPTLLWFWAPWCPICAGEAPAVEELSTSEDLQVVAIGGRDKAANGPAFTERYGLTTPTILFDEPMAVWNHYKIPGQPAAVLLDREGVERGRWLGPFSNEEVLAKARTL